MAPLVLISWPLVSLAFFAVLGQARGLIWSVTVGFLFLPEAYGFDLPALPPYNKYSAIGYAALIGTFLFRPKQSLRGVKDGPIYTETNTLLGGIVTFLFVLLLLSPLGTWVTNTETLVNGPSLRSPLSIRDAIQMSIRVLLDFVPLFLAWRILKHPDHHRELLFAVVVLSAFYCLPVLFEWRMSPQLNIWIYGYFQHDWVQHLRGGGYRPIVFLQHGLVIGLLLSTATLAALALSREKSQIAPMFFWIAVWTFFVLVLSRNFGATFLAILFAPIVLFLTFKMQARIAAIVAVLFLLYPILKQSGLSPEQAFLDLFSNVAPERAASLGVRVRNEDELLARALEKPLFGWGGYARAHIVNDQGYNTTLIDGIWIVVLGQRGWIGYLAFFGLVLAPILFLQSVAKRKQLTASITGMAMVLSANLVDMIPNSTLSPLAMLMLGSIAAFVQYDLKRDETSEEDAKGVRPALKYSRFAPSQKGDTPVSSYSRHDRGHI